MHHCSGVWHVGAKDGRRSTAVFLSELVPWRCSWVAFGLGETKGMAGADIVYYEHASKKLVDSFSVGNAKPTEDPCQDWTLVKAEQIGGKLTVHVSRKLVSSDTMDRNFTDDSAYPLQLTPVIAAWGDSAGIQYHTTSGRAAAGVRFFGTSEAEAIEKLKADGSLLTKDVLAENFAVPTTETTYHEFCYDVQVRRNSFNSHFSFFFLVRKKRRSCANSFMTLPTANPNKEACSFNSIFWGQKHVFSLFLRTHRIRTHSAVLQCLYAVHNQSSD